jgi:hypothetical protein
MANNKKILCPYQHYRPGRHGIIDKGEISVSQEFAALERFKSQIQLGRTNSDGVSTSSEPWLFGRYWIVSPG